MSDEFLADPLAWRAAKSPTVADIELLAQKIFASLPAKFRSLCEGLIIKIEDFASEDVLDDLDIDSDYDLLGLFQGVGLPFQSVTASAQLPNTILLYRRPILDYWAEHDETLGAVVTHVLVHEIGHHFGLSDRDMEKTEKEAG